MRRERSAEPFAEKYPRLVAEVEEGARLAAVVRAQLSSIEVKDAR